MRPVSGLKLTYVRSFLDVLLLLLASSSSKLDAKLAELVLLPI